MRILITLLYSMLIPTIGTADDWNQWMGPNRDNRWNEDGIVEQFPAGGPKILWRTKIGGGYAGPAVAGGKVFVTDYITSDNVKVANFERNEFSGMERVLCLDEATGDELWNHEYPVKYTISYPAGPRCTPVVDNGKVYTLGAEGNLICFDAENGEVIWQVDLPRTYNTKTALWGYAGHPLVDGENLITLAGGDGSHVVAFDKNNGEEKWRAQTSVEQGYSPPTIVSAGGVRQLILLKPDAVASVDPENGSQYWSVPYEASSNSIIMSPVMAGDYLYAGGYDKKSILLKLNRDKPSAEIVWRDKARSAISPVNVQPFVDADAQIIYGMDQNGELRATKLPDGDLLWSSPAPVGKRAQGSGTAFLVKQADRFWLFNELGELVIARISPDGYEEIDRAKVIEPSGLAFGRKVVWSMPAFANRRAYIRNDNEIISVDLAK